MLPIVTADSLKFSRRQARRLDEETKKQIQRELVALKERITSELRELKLLEHGQISRADFYNATDVSTASIDPIEKGDSWPDLPTLHKWLRGCKSSLAELFQSPTEQFSEATIRTHRRLELILKIEPTHWMFAAIDREYTHFMPALTPRKKKRVVLTQADHNPHQRIHDPPSQTKGAGDGSQRQGTGQDVLHNKTKLRKKA